MDVHIFHSPVFLGLCTGQYTLMYILVLPFLSLHLLTQYFVAQTAPLSASTGRMLPAAEREKKTKGRKCDKKDSGTGTKLNILLVPWLL